MFRFVEYLMLKLNNICLFLKHIAEILDSQRSLKLYEIATTLADTELTEIRVNLRLLGTTILSSIHSFLFLNVWPRTQVTINSTRVFM